MYQSSSCTAQKTSVLWCQSSGFRQGNYSRVIFFFPTFAAANLVRRLGYCFDNSEQQNLFPFRSLHRVNQSKKMHIQIACQKVIMSNTELFVSKKRKKYSTLEKDQFNFIKLSFILSQAWKLCYGQAQTKQVKKKKEKCSQCSCSGPLCTGESNSV